MNPGENTLSSAKLALSVRKLRSQVDADLLTSEPIAIVGIGCRLPGGIASADDYWRFVTSAGEAVREVPRDRWDADAYYDPDLAAPGKMNGRWGGFLDGADLFDPGFFGISPREAAAMDPQQRLTLEVAWAAIHDSGRGPEQLAGSSTGVFVAVYNTDYNRLLLGDRDAIGPHTCAGASHSMVSGRISFLLDLHGPSLSIDSACSSSLVAIHLAVQSLRIGDCDAAIAGGVSLKLRPEHYLTLSKLSMLSPDGRCHTFDAGANGFVPGEGCGLVVLKRLSDALAAGDRIRAVIRGSAVGQDGRTASLTAPNGVAQQQVVRSALANARVNAADIGYVETHGTGTALGDPIEVEALASVIGSGSKPCALGAVKSNFGHLEAAAGVAGLIKTALVLENGEIPPNLHYQSLNPHISLEGTRFHIPVKRTPWGRESGPRLAGVSSFGFTGTNAHLILEEPPQLPSRSAQPERPGPYLLTISARTAAARDESAARYAGFLSGEGRQYSVAEICRNAALRRDHYEERLAVFGETHDELRTRLEEAVAGRPAQGVAQGRADLTPGPVAWVFSGQGSQWPRMGARLIQTEPVFAAAIERCDALIRSEAGWSLREILEAGEAESLLHRTQYAQPAIFAVQVALADLWRSWGLRPAMVFGHSVGEIAAAHVAGVLGLEDAVRIAVHRGRLMDAASGHGRMLSVALPASVVEAEIPESVSVAAINAPASTVVSGDPDAIEQLAKTWQGRGISAQLLPVDYAFHSAQMEPFRQALPQLLGRVPVKEPEIPIISTVTGAAAGPGDYDAEYWGRNVRRPVRFQQAVERALAAGARCFLEIGPHAVLSSALSECAPEIAVIPSLRRNRDERTFLAAAVAKFYTLGHQIDWKSFCGASQAILPLPAYPYQRRRYWVADAPKEAAVQSHTDRPAAPPELPGEPLRSPALRGKAWQATVTAENTLIRDHKIAGAVVFPLAGFLQAAAAAWKQASGKTEVSITGLEIGEALQILEPVPVQTVIQEDRLEIYSLAQDQWKTHVSGRLKPVTGAPPFLATTTAPDEIDVDGYYRAMFESGLEYGPQYRSIRELRAGAGSAEAFIVVEPDVARQGGPISPALLDGCLQTVLAASGNTGTLYMPAGIDRFDLYREAGAAVRCFMRTADAGDVFTADFDLVDEAGAVVASGRGLRMKRVRAMRTAYEFRWESAARQFSPQSGRNRWAVVAEEGPLAEAVVAALQRRGAECARHSIADLSGIDAQGYRGVLCLPAAHSGEEVYTAALRVLQQIGAANTQSERELWLATCNAQRVTPDDACDGYAQAVLWGLGRTAALEYPDLRCVRVDLDGSDDAANALAEEMLSAEAEDELAFRGRARYTAALARVAPAALTPPARQLVIRQRGSLDALSYEPVLRRTPAVDEVEVEVHTTALNFRDVLNALGGYPGDPGPLGLEFCGRVLSVGRNVTHCKAGDLVMGVGWGAFADVFIAKAALVTPVPEGLDAEAAVTLPNAFATAYHCLVTQGRIQKNDRVLIHAAAGGVGMMAVQIAQHAGAEVFATAGSQEKREFLRALGVRHIYDSRTLDFAAQMLDATGGQGIDLALNSLAGDFIPATLSVMAGGGRFVEIGKTGIWDAARVAALGKDIRYSVVDVGLFLDHDPEVIAACFRELHSLVGSGAIRPLPTHSFGFEQAAEAFRFMAQAKHTGKIVLRHAAAGRELSGTWLLTGGLGALGLETARWLAAHGASTLVLAGRRPPTGESLEAVEKLKNCGVRVETCLADVSRRQDVEALLATIRANWGRLDGIVHLAGTLDDGVLAQQDQDRFERVFSPKARGARHLHELAPAGLRHFILFSSAAAVLGSPGQGNYAASNAALDGLANYRAAKQLPAISIAWGAWADAGMAAAVDASGARRTMSLLRPVKAADYLAALEWALGSGRSNLALLSADWDQWTTLPGRSRTRVAAAAAAPAVHQPAAAVRTISEEIAGLPPSRQRKALLEYLRAQTARILGLGEEYPINESEPLMRMGLDSLMALELRNTLARSFGRQLSATLLFDHPTLGALTAYLMGDAEAGTPETDPAGDALLDEISALSDEEAEQLLADELSAGSGS